jgi:hypothetical protein
MKCGDKTKQMMVDLASGELRGLSKWRLMRHVAVCAACRAEWEEVQRLWQGLGALSTSPVTETASRAALNRLNAASVRPTTRKGAISMKKRVIILAIAAVLVIAAGAFAEKYINSRVGGTISGHGHSYQVRGDFRGNVRIYDPQNKEIGIIGVGDGDPVHGVADITADGKQFQFTGPGRYEMRDQNGVLHGYAELVPTSDQEVAQEQAVWNQTPAKFEDLVPWIHQQQWAGNSVSGGGGGPFYLYEFNKGENWLFVMHGVGEITLTNAAGQKVGVNGSAAMSARKLGMMRAIAPHGVDITDNEIKYPRVAIVVNGKTTYAQGYGTYPIKDANGQLLATIKAYPPVWQK